ncbi:hypothetical protein ACS0TY_008749 [Phlomoides rotata]
MGVGMVLRDEFGSFTMGWRTLLFAGCVEVKIGEAIGFFEALSWAKSLNLDKVEVEGDVKVVVDVVGSYDPKYMVFRDYVEGCKGILAPEPYFSVSFIKRSANVWAHAFVRVAHFYENSNIWVDPSNFVVDLLPFALASQ